MTGCSTKKRRYKNDIDAQQALNEIKKRAARDKVPIRFYPCSLCNGFHLTSSPGHNGKPKELKLYKLFLKYLHK